MTPEQFAAQFEKARYESMLSRQWADLRDGERQTRTDLALAALTTCGLAEILRDMHDTALRAEVFEGLLAQRDAEITRIRAEQAQDLAEARAHHAAELTKLRAEHAAELERVRAEAEAALRRVQTEHEGEVDRRRALRDGMYAERHSRGEAGPRLHEPAVA